MATPDASAVPERLRLEVERVMLAIGLGGRDELALVPLQQNVMVVGVLGRLPESHLIPLLLGGTQLVPLA